LCGRAGSFAGCPREPARMRACTLSETPCRTRQPNHHEEQWFKPHYLLYPRKRTFDETAGMSAKCHVWTAPSWQELSSRLQRWSVQPCVRPLSAVHLTAGHNAFRGSGPVQSHAFDSNALALMGCPDRRIDRLCITCCSPSQLHITPGCPARLVYAASAAGLR